jgi:hypothetical protein
MENEKRFLFYIVGMLKWCAAGLQVFVRELISNASDALEKLRYLTLTGEITEGPDARPLEIHIATDKQNRTLTIQVLFHLSITHVACIHKNEG